MNPQSEFKAPVIEPEVPARRTHIPWQTSSYDDEATLLHLRLKYPQASWSRISGIFNASVPSSRERTADSITSKGKRLMKSHQQTPTSSTVLESSLTPSEAQPHEYFHQVCYASGLPTRANRQASSQPYCLIHHGNRLWLTWRLCTAPGIWWMAKDTRI